MNEKCKYCDYVSKCSRICEYNSIMCILHRSFPKIVDKSYEDLQQRIDKAIEFIKECDDETDNGIYDIDSGIKEQLLSILKGEDNNE